jgi:multidrug/hemolysin transport system permease protein
MNTLTLAVRNLRLYFRDRTSVFFSLLSVFIIIGLYVLFLGDVLASQISGMGVDARFLVDSWIVAGLMAVTSVTTTLGALGIMVQDRAKGVIKDFMAAPIGRASLGGGYILSALLIGVIMSAVALAFCEAYIMLNGGALLSFPALLEVLGIMILSVLSGGSMVFFMVTFFRSENAFAIASTIVGTLIGFITGIYIPIGNLPDAVQTVIRFFPTSHSALLFRQTMMEVPMASVFAGAPAGAQDGFSTLMGVKFQYGDTLADPSLSVWVLAATTVLFFGLATLNLRRKRDR